MRAIGTFLSAIAEWFAADGRLVRMRFRTTLDTLVTLAITALAIVLTLGYQILGRWARRSDRAD